MQRRRNSRRAISRAPRSSPCTSPSTIKAEKSRAGLLLFWPESLRAREKWRKRGRPLSKLCSPFTIPTCWPGVTSIWAEFSTSSRIAKRPRKTTRPPKKAGRQRCSIIVPRWPREIQPRKPGTRRRAGWLLPTRHALHTKRKDLMQRLPLVPMALLALSLGAMAPASRAMQRTSPAPIHAKSQQELADYKADYSLNGGSAMEQAAISFAQKYPESELRLYLFARAMREYQRENNAAGIQRMGERVLALDPDHTVALVLTATALADSLWPSDPDRDKKIAEIKKN